MNMRIFTKRIDCDGWIILGCFVAAVIAYIIGGICP